MVDQQQEQTPAPLRAAIGPAVRADAGPILPRLPDLASLPAAYLREADLAALEAYVLDLRRTTEGLAAFVRQVRALPPVPGQAVDTWSARPAQTPDVPLAEVEWNCILAAILRHRGNFSGAARGLGLPLRSLYVKIRERGLDVPTLRQQLAEKFR